MPKVVAWRGISRIVFQLDAATPQHSSFYRWIEHVSVFTKHMKSNVSRAKKHLFNFFIRNIKLATNQEAFSADMAGGCLRIRSGVTRDVSGVLLALDVE